MQSKKKEKRISIVFSPAVRMSVFCYLWKRLFWMTCWLTPKVILSNLNIQKFEKLDMQGSSLGTTAPTFWSGSIYIIFHSNTLFVPLKYIFQKINKPFYQLWVLGITFLKTWSPSLQIVNIFLSASFWEIIGM